jgi:Fe-S-cluster containining protein
LAETVALPVSGFDAAQIAARDPSLRMDVDHGLRFTHMMAEDARRSVFETAVTVLALVEELKERGTIDAERFELRRHAREKIGADEAAARAKIHIYGDVDKYSLSGADVPCAELIPICRGRCCTLHFPLSKQDLRERVIKWNYVMPYIIRQRDTDRYCVHNDPDSRGCTEYEHRPAVCRTYDCRNDRRIWIDFDKRIPTVDPKLEPRDAPVPSGILID